MLAAHAPGERRVSLDRCSCGYAGALVYDRFGGEYWFLCPSCDEFVLEGEVPVSSGKL